MSMTIEVSPEPGPNFTIAKADWGVLWPIHYSLFGILFAFLTIFSIHTIIALNISKQHFQRKKIFVIINVFVCCFCGLSALSLLIDPYESGEHIEKINFRGILYIILSFRTPCLTSAFMFIQLSLSETTKLQLYSKWLQSNRVIIIITIIHFTLILLADIMLVFVANIKWFLVSCQTFTFCLGLMICISSIHIGCKVRVGVTKSKRTVSGYTKRVVVGTAVEMEPQFVTPNKRSQSYGVQPQFSKQLTPTNITYNHAEESRDDQLNSSSYYIFGRVFSIFKNKNIEGTNITKNRGLSTMKILPSISARKQKHSLKKVNSTSKSCQIIVVLTMVIAFFGFCYCGCVIFSIVSVFMLDNYEAPDPWNWFILETTKRICELGMMSVMVYLTNRNTNTIKKLKEKWKRRPRDRI